MVIVTPRAMTSMPRVMMNGCRPTLRDAEPVERSERAPPPAPPDRRPAATGRRCGHERARVIAAKPTIEPDREVDAGRQDDERHPDPDDAHDRCLAGHVGQVADREEGGDSAAPTTTSTSRASRIPFAADQSDEPRLRAKRATSERAHDPCAAWPSRGPSSGVRAQLTSLPGGPAAVDHERRARHERAMPVPRGTRPRRRRRPARRPDGAPRCARGRRPRRRGRPGPPRCRACG